MKPTMRPSLACAWPFIASNFSTFFFRLPPPPPLAHARNITQIRPRHLHSSVSPPPPPPPPPLLASSPPSLLPLFLRPPKYTTTVSDLLEWHSWAKSLAASIGSSFEDSDNGPDSTLLCRELNWLLEDVLDGFDPWLMHKAVARDDPDTICLKADVQELYSLWKQRIEERRPFQYMVGCAHWRDLILCVREGVLIPRPETEIIVDLVGDVILKDQGLRDGLWADLGTGSGAIAIGIAKILGNYGSVIATDLSPVAIQVASFNVERYSLQDKIEVREGSWLEPLKGVEGKVAGLVSNPPYIPSDDISGLPAEVGRHEPRLALDGGSEGMDDLLHLCNRAASMLKPGGFLAFETNGEKQCKFLVGYMQNQLPGSFCNVNTVSDFAGIQRFVTGFRNRRSAIFLLYFPSTIQERKQINEFSGAKLILLICVALLKVQQNAYAYSHLFKLKLIRVLHPLCKCCCSGRFQFLEMPPTVNYASAPKAVSETCAAVSSSLFLCQLYKLHTQP